MDLNTPASELHLVGPAFVKRIKKLEIETVRDLIAYFPFRYDDYSLVSAISRVQPGETLTIRGQLLSIKNEYTRLGKKIQKAEIADNSGKMEITWFNQPFLVKTLKTGEWYQFSGKADWFGRKIVLISPENEKIPHTTYHIPHTLHTGRLVPVYSETYGVSSKWLRARIAFVLPLIKEQLKEFLPFSILVKEKLLPYKEAIWKIHFPENRLAAQKARERLAFDELFLIQLAGLLRKSVWQTKALSRKLTIDQEKIDHFTANLPFELTEAQQRCLGEILRDLAESLPMNRLLQGDVGSGKTVVAAAAMYATYLNGLQSVLMAPTEILAQQHYQTINALLKRYGVKIALQTSTTKQCSNETMRQYNIFIGTHALIQKNVNFQNLGLVVIDEQHRFGVEQRTELVKKATTPHILTMTATPIPRTIALTLYGDLDLSVIDQAPKGRQKVKTWVVPPSKREAAYDWIRKHVKGTDEQAFIICPLIEESETLQSIKAATVEFNKLANNIFPDLRIGLLHGRLKSQEKEKIINEFRAGKLDILVSTPVVEVGIDIPRATIMMIEGADRFGLAQLHQLRGRVGRGERQSFCLLFSENKNIRSAKRLKAMEKLEIGVELAELDLKMRGPGEIYGVRQHGFPSLRLASLSDLSLIERAREAAKSIIDKIDEFSPLQEQLKKYTIQKVQPN